MSEMMIKLALDVTVAIMLAATIYYCIKLNRRVQMLQDSKSELATLIKQFDESTQQATVSINEIHRASKRINQNIQEKLDRANYLADDLAFMIERANKTANKIEQQISDGRSVESRASRADKIASSATEKNTARIKQDASIRNKESRRPSRRNLDEVVPENSSSPNDKKGIEAMMERISELRGGQTESTSAKPQRPMARMRSKSEQDLMQALKQREKSKV